MAKFPPCGSQWSPTLGVKIMSLKICERQDDTSAVLILCCSMYFKSSRRAPETHSITRIRLCAVTIRGIRSAVFCL